MKTTTENLAQELLCEELRQTALEAFEKNAIDGISLKAALKLCNHEKNQTQNIFEVEERISYIKSVLQSTFSSPELSTSEVKQKIKEKAAKYFDLSRINEREYLYYSYLIDDPKQTSWALNEALKELENLGSGLLIDLDKVDGDEIEVKYTNTNYYFEPTKVVFNATFILQAIAKETPEEVAQTLDQSMAFIIDLAEKADLKMTSNVRRIYSILRELRDGVVYGYSNAVLGTVIKYGSDR